ncbi:MULTISPECIES: LacI family DNA-binding transcriptional regulator [unclassified Enterococcus]|uniref:LacI family DNA-binding transcriptional regulator n=1 Tax=unclassified Enterococcus TaxID=2608891 RepID=UPI00155466F7|nr:MULTISPECIES: LacI family DNA-binding transcriptional regulator [unclassified Enterococcus]MBS7576894.1 LacI family DNA-binding transcriptional regulator [Enterococcus sp. MMGLQ5-2]MBS7584301.1 LacI family DNA-binding transcriptional regulator [Enterococcus sp. MMGLQ5-1]NPD12157.1 LacI family DNA-binding transcriptional regulator [Enterococcus sp. MMGLQ5-1]NPD36729.1 LacI family DNA-binding transcriptional regulator [Enterococcus sp. MMGLQ5-2]
MKRYTLEDVAKLAGVTSTTVSRVINNRGNISDKTRKKVYAAMESLNYRPNALARTLLGKQSFIVGLIFPTTNHPFYGEIIYYLEKILSEFGYKVMICNSMNDSKKEQDFVQMLLANQVDGLIVGTHNTDIEIYKKANLPIVSIDRILSENIPVVSSDNYQGGFLATEYLYDKGARHIVHINSLRADEAPYSYERRQGYIDFLTTKALSPSIFEVDYELSFDVKKNILIGILELNKAIDAMFIADDLTALLTRQVCQMLNRDVNIIGYDGSELIIKYYPDLATIQQPIEEMSSEAVKLLIREINQDFTSQGVKVKCPVQLLANR